MLDDVLREYSFLKHEESVLTNTAHTDCLACRESMTACHTYSNKKLFRYLNGYAQNWIFEIFTSSLLLFMCIHVYLYSYSSKEERPSYLQGKMFESSEKLDTFVKHVRNKGIV